MKRTFLLSLPLLFLAGCAAQPLYEWGSYNQALLVYAKNPGETKQFSEQLRKNIAAAEKKNRVPPGMYAELGYSLTELGEDREAVEWFAKERDRWPESAVLMTRLIERLGKASAGSSIAGAGSPAPANQ